MARSLTVRFKTFAGMKGKEPAFLPWHRAEPWAAMLVALCKDMPALAKAGEGELGINHPDWIVIARRLSAVAIHVARSVLAFWTMDCFGATSQWCCGII